MKTHSRIAMEMGNASQRTAPMPPNALSKPPAFTALKRVSGLTAGALVLMLAACASTPPPTDQMAVANAALSHAVGAGAAELAPTEMAQAREKMVLANQALTAKDNARALVLAQEVAVDAQVAEAKAESVKARKAAEAIQQANQALREEMARKAVPSAAPK